MIYRSNLTAPDISLHFKHLHSRVMGHSFGHDVPSDWADKADDDPVFGIYKRCGMWTHDEAAILYNCVRGTRLRSTWIDIGAHTGWTSKHINLASNGGVECIDPMFRVNEWRIRFQTNTGFPLGGWVFGGTSEEYFRAAPHPSADGFVINEWRIRFQTNTGFPLGGWVFGGTSEEYFRAAPHPSADGFVIDGDHEPGAPLRDAQNAAKHLARAGVIMLHDGVGRPVREAVEWLMAHGFKARAYFTPHLVFCCWRGDFTPPDHVPDPLVKAAHLDGRYPDFDFGRMS